MCEKLKRRSVCCGGCVYVGEGERAKRMSGKGELMNGGDRSVALLSSARAALYGLGAQPDLLFGCNSVMLKPSNIFLFCQHEKCN